MSSSFTFAVCVNFSIKNIKKVNLIFNLMFIYNSNQSLKSLKKNHNNFIKILISIHLILYFLFKIINMKSYCIFI